MAEEEIKNNEPQDKTRPVPAPVVLALSVVAELENAGGQTPEALAAIKKGLPVLAMKLSQMGETITAEELKNHALQGATHIEGLCKSFNRVAVKHEKTYQEIIAEIEKINEAANSNSSDREMIARLSVLRAAVEAGDFPAVKFLTRHMPVKFLDEDSSIVFCAINGRQDKIAAHLIKMGINVIDGGHNFLDAAVNSRSLPLVKLLLQKGAGTNVERWQHTLNSALKAGDIKILNLLMRAGVEFPKDMDERTQVDLLANAMSSGEASVVDLAVRHGCDIKKYGIAALDSGFYACSEQILRFLVERGCDIGNSEHVLSRAISYGSPETVRYVIAQGATINNFTKNIFYASVQYPCLDNIKVFLEQPHEFKTYAKEIMLHAVQQYEIELIHHLAERGVDIPDERKWTEYQALLPNIRLWEKLHGNVFEGIVHENPRWIDLHEFLKIREIFQEEFKKPNRLYDNRMAYKTAALFGTAERSLAYFKKWGAEHVGRSSHPFRQCMSGIDLPKNGNPDFKAWGDAILQHGLKMMRLLQHAGNISQPMRSADGKSWSLIRTQEEVAVYAFKNGRKNREIAKLAYQGQFSEDCFEEAVKLTNKCQRKLAANDNNPKPNQNIPEITIPGDKFGMAGYSFFKLPSGDPRGLFLGALTGCCQHLAGDAQECVEHGFLSPDGGFYVVANDNDKEIVGQTWAWRGKQGELVFDSLEGLGDRMSKEKWEGICAEISRQFSGNAGDIASFNIGTGSRTPIFSYKQAEEPAISRQDIFYGDSAKQYVVWKK